MTELAKQYEPKEAQSKWFSFWEEHGYFDANPPSQQVPRDVGQAFQPDQNAPLTSEAQSTAARQSGQRGKADLPRPPHTIMIPLPNVTGALHMGHALNGTLQDLLTRWRRMQGYEALWMPGTDHAGIATQAVVERRMLEEEGLTRHQVGREALVKRIWEWKDKYEARIIGQQKMLGASCDWRRVRFTLDDVCSRAVRRTFFKFFKDGLIYRGKRLVNWDTYLQTAVADDEVFHEDVAGSFWTFNYPVVDDAGQPTGERISFSTTRPETMLGDTAVCVHPTDERYTHLVGKHVRIPVNGRVIPIIADALLADKTLGTGCVKVTPAHDPNDYACYQRNKQIGVINILNPDGTLNENGGKYQGLTMPEARKQVVQEMETLGHLEKVEDRTIPLMHSDRSKTPIEPYLSDQWFVKMDTLAEAAMQAVRDGKVKFFPSRYTTSYMDWLGEKRDWCISRQLWWGHRIPVWKKVESRDAKAECLSEFGATLASNGVEVQFSPLYRDVISARYSDGPGHDEKTLLVCVDKFLLSDGEFSEFASPNCDDEVANALAKLGFIQDDDVLDTWFSSALWPHATLGWPDTLSGPPLISRSTDAEDAEDAELFGSIDTKLLRQQLANGKSPSNEVLSYFYPGNVLVTSRDIITLWVARMVLTGLYNMGEVPFRHVCIHPKILDGFGQTMSKSKGNGVDPLDLIDKYGTDAVRFTIASFAGETQDVRLPVGYECPHCGHVIPQTLEHQKAVPGGGDKPRVKCPKCKAASQYSSPWFEPDPGEPVARVVSERFEYGRNFCNKLWNAARFAMLNLEGFSCGTVAESDLKLEDQWILSRLSHTAGEVTSMLGRYRFDEATRILRDFVWNEFCDWYLEMIKPRLRDDSLKPTAQRVLVSVLDTILRLLSPFIPFITEELWQRLNEIAPVRGLVDGQWSMVDGKTDKTDLPLPSTINDQPSTPSVMIAPWPDVSTSWQNRDLERRFSRLQETIVAVRNVRALYNIAPSTPIQLHMRCSAGIAADMQNVASQFENLSKALLAAAGAEVEAPTCSASFNLTDADGFIPLEGLIDRDAELARQRKERDRLVKAIDSNEKKLANEGFVAKAPADVLQQTRDSLDNYKKQLASVEAIIKALE
jgi:valyl-tRNA synthetase